jgi:hypothetical protein
MMMSRFAVLGVLLPLLGQGAATDWIRAQHPTYTIFYEHGYEADRDFTAIWMDRTESLMQSKYGVTDTGRQVSFYLYTIPNPRADVGHAQIDTTGNVSTIHYLAPSAPTWKTTTKTTSLGLPYDQNFHAKVIISEYIPLAHRAVQATRTGGWRYYDAPSWVSQGLQEYDGFFHSTEFNRTTAFAKMREFGSANLENFSCCDNDLPQIADTYNGGALVMAYLAERFGEDVHVRLLRSTQPTFALALKQQTGVVDVESLFGDFRHWLFASQQ